LSTGNFIIIWERWTHKVKVADVNGYKFTDGKYDSTWAIKIDENGKILKSITGPFNARITRGDQPVLWNEKVTWITGDIAGGNLVAHTLDSKLNYNVISLPTRPIN